MHRRHETKAIGHGVEIRDLDDDRSLTMSTDDALRVMADLPTAILASPTDEAKALLRATLADMLAAIEGAEHG